MSRMFVHEFRGKPKKLLTVFREKSRGNGIHFTGNEHTGEASGRGFDMEYRVKGQAIAITVHRKPWLIPWSLVESKLRGELLRC